MDNTKRERLAELRNKVAVEVEGLDDFRKGEARWLALTDSERDDLTILERADVFDTVENEIKAALQVLEAHGIVHRIVTSQEFSIASAGMVSDEQLKVYKERLHRDAMRHIGIEILNRKAVDLRDSSTDRQYHKVDYTAIVIDASKYLSIKRSEGL